MQRREKILAQKADPKVPEWLSYRNSHKVIQNPHFLKKCKGGTKENFLKIAHKVALVWKVQKHSGANGIILYLVCTYSAKTGEDFGANSCWKTARRAKLWQFSQGHPKKDSGKSAKGEQGKVFKNRPKSSPCLKGRKALWRKMHSPLIFMSLKCKNWRKFWGIRRLQKCRKARLWQFLQGHPKPAFSEKVQGEDQEQFFKNRPKSSPH